MLVPAKCPSCGAAIQLESDNDWVTCSYCNTSSFVQKPTGPPPPANQMMVISIGVPGMMPMQVNIAPGAFGNAPYGAVGPFGMGPMTTEQARREAHARVAGAQMFAAHQMTNAYAQAGRRIKTSMIISIVFTLVIFLFVGGIVMFSMFGAMFWR
jgi:hypothetical protein